MLRVSKLTDAEYVLGQVATGLEDYYLGSGEAPGVWTGRLAGDLGLEGVVDGAPLRALLDRRHPECGAWLTEGGKPVKVKAFDVTLSAPKSASLLHALGDVETASAVSIAHVEAVTAALGFLEEHAAVTRRQSGGIRRRVGTSGWAAATFVHRTSREGDPQLHTHCVIPNLVRRDDGVWMSLDGAEIYRWAKAAGSIYQETLRRHLVDRLGVAWGADRNGCRELVGISEAQLRVFSKRTAQIEAHLAVNGGTESLSPETHMDADERASLATRRAKNRDWTHALLADRWRDEAAAAGLPVSAELTVSLCRAAAGNRPAKRDSSALFEALVDPESGLCARDSHFGEAQVIERIAAAGAGTLTVDEITQLARRFVESRLVVRLIDRDPSGRTPTRYSTAAHRQIEDRVLDNLDIVSDRSCLAVRRGLLDEAIAACPHLGEDQAAAVRDLCGTGSALRLLSAPAGHGKTTTLAAAVMALRSAGREVVAVSTTNQAVDQLRQGGLEATTVTRFALDCPHLPDGTVVICDEFSQLPTREADVILAAVAACRGGQVWMVGDPLQAQPVAAGGLAHRLTAETGRPRMVTASLSVNRRQADPDERTALARLREGDVPTSQTLRHQRGWEHDNHNAASAIDAMAAAVAADIERHGASKVAALAVSHAECEELADRVRERLADRGAIAGPAIEGPGWAGPRSYQAGDRILLHAHLLLTPAEGGGKLHNGSTATVAAAGPAGLVVRPDRPHTTDVVVPAAFVQARGPDGRPQVSHSWASSIDGVQGGTYAQVHLLATPAIDRYRGYVGQSRGIQPTHTWNTTPPLDDDHGGRLVTAEGTPAQQVLAGLRRAQPKTFAADDDPYRIDQQLRRRIRYQEDRFADIAPDVTRDLEVAEALLARAHSDLADSERRAQYWRDQIAATAGLRGLTPNRYERHQQARSNLRSVAQTIDDDTAEVAERAGELQRLQTAVVEAGRLEQANARRLDRIGQLEDQLAAHWSEVVVAAARAGDPYAYGRRVIDVARQHLEAQIPAGDIQITGPANAEVEQARQALVDLDMAILQRQPVNTPPAARPAQTAPDTAMDVHIQHQMYEQVMAIYPTPGIQPDF